MCRSSAASSCLAYSLPLGWRTRVRPCRVQSPKHSPLPEEDPGMAKTITVNESVVGPELVKELELFELPGEKLSSFYLNLKSDEWENSTNASRIGLKNELAD